MSDLVPPGRSIPQATIVFESMFGNTEAVAEAVATGLRDRGAQVTVVQAGAAYDHAVQGQDLLVLAAPTHALALSRPASRADAVARGADADRATTGLREWLEALEAAPGPHPVVAVLDTRARITRHWPGSAGASSARTMRRRGFRVLARTSFYVDGVTGPLLPGELDRARSWGRELADDLRLAVAGVQPGS